MKRLLSLLADVGDKIAECKLVDAIAVLIAGAFLVLLIIVAFWPLVVAAIIAACLVRTIYLIVERLL